MTAERARRTAGVVALVIGLVSGLTAFGSGAGADPPPLGRAEPFAVLAGSTVTNVGSTTIFGSLGVSPGTEVTGAPAVQAPGVIHTGPESPAGGAQTDARAAWVHLMGEPCPPGNDLTGMDLGGKTLKPGVYCFSSEAQLTGTLTLDFEGNPNAIFVFKTVTMLTTASASVVKAINTGGESNPCNVFWQIGSSATLGTSSVFLGTIIADQSITAGSGTNVMGRLFALAGQVSLNNNTVTRPVCGPTPTSSTSTTSGPTTTTTLAPTTTTTSGSSTTTTVAPTTTTTSGSPTTTTSAPATTTTAPPGGTTTTTTTAPPGGTTPTATTMAPGTTTTAPASVTTTTVEAGSTTTTGQASAGATTTVGPGATTTSSAPLLSPAAPALRIQNLPRTGQGPSGPLTLAVVSILLGAMLLLAPRRGAVPLLSGAGYTSGGLDHRQPHTSAEISVQTAAIGQVATRAPESFDVMEDLERQLQAADARMARLRATHRER